jgi:uncharacterized membrane protein YadS
MIIGNNTGKSYNFSWQNHDIMIKLFQVIFLIASIILIVLNMNKYNKYIQDKKDGKTSTINWFHFALTSLVALGCILNIITGWLGWG